MDRLSVAIIAKDRSVILSECLESARKVSDDVVIVTNADHKFVNYSDQKNYAVSLCKNDWILSLDADEYLSPGLINELSTINYQLSTFSAYTIPRLNYIFGKPIYHTNWEPASDTHVWLFNKHKAKWVGDVHEEVVVDGQIGRLKNHKIHYNYTSVEQYISKMNHYTSLETKPENPLFDFLRRFIWHLGFLDGWHGFFLSYLQAIYALTAFLKLRLKTTAPYPTGPSFPPVGKS